MKLEYAVQEVLPKYPQLARVSPEVLEEFYTTVTLELQRQRGEDRRVIWPPASIPVLESAYKAGGIAACRAVFPGISDPQIKGAIRRFKIYNGGVGRTHEARKRK